MLENIRMLFDTSDFPARWHCGNWSAAHGWTHVIADLAIALAYLLIPLALARYCWVKRRELEFPMVIWLFAAFIFSCGATHFVEAIIFYHPIYRFSALMKVATAAVSLSTVVAVTRIAPKALELPGLRKENRKLQEQVEVVTRNREALARSNSELEAYTRDVTHDLRNPATSALFMGELAREAVAAGDLAQADEQLRMVNDSLRQMETMIADLHSRSLATAKSQELVPIPLDGVVESVTKALNPLLAMHHVHLQVDDLPVVVGNQGMLVRLFTNLIENAVKYRAPENARIHISSEATPDHHLVRLKDNGRGMPAADRERIFEPQVRAANTADTTGSGLGLALCRKIMASHGGSIRVTEHNGPGATFELAFPRPRQR